ncbi:MAG: LacI family DNA-binding transcriptional regulator, partial [Caldilineaceae bacterium]|nr:LacI family DNA-binding transcriptional regulator [Caldilineaceae bacterium]
MSATLRDVALEAGVSIRTVSRVVNNRAEIAQSTRQRVLTAINKLDYRPNSLARSLVSGKTRSIAVVIPQITDPFYPEFVQGVESVARVAEYHVFLSNTDDDPVQEYRALEALAGKQVEGVILCGTRLSHEQLVRANALHNLVVVTDRPPREIPSIHVQEEEGLTAITTHLLQLGHRAIAHIARPQYNRSSRQVGYQRALESAGVPVEQWLVESISVADIENGRGAATALLTHTPQLTAITCYN